MHSRNASPLSNLIGAAFGTMVPTFTEKETHGRTQHELPQASIRKPHHAAPPHRRAPRSAKTGCTPRSTKQRGSGPTCAKDGAQSTAPNSVFSFNKASLTATAITAAGAFRSKQAAHPGAAPQRKQRGAFRTSCTRPRVPLIPRAEPTSGHQYLRTPRLFAEAKPAAPFRGRGSGARRGAVPDHLTGRSPYHTPTKQPR